MDKKKNILFVFLVLTGSLLAQDREATKSTIRERELERIVHQINNNNNDYREPDRNTPQNSTTNKSSTKK